MAFTGFTNETFDFLAGVHFSPTELFVKSNYANYTNHVLRPMQALAMQLSPYITELLDAEVDTQPRRTVSRLRRDTRFSNDKTPYRDYVWLSFKRWEPAKDSYGFFFAIGYNWFDFGFGFYDVERSVLLNIKEKMLLFSDTFLGLVNEPEFKAIYTLSGADYVRPIKKELVGTEIYPWYQKKNFWFAYEAPLHSSLYDGTIEQTLIHAIKTAAPVYRFILSAMYPQEGIV